MTSASNHHAGPAGDEDRTWILVVAATGWAVLTTIVVLLAVGTWSVDSSPTTRITNPGISQNGDAGRTPTPQPSTTADNR